MSVIVDVVCLSLAPIVSPINITFVSLKGKGCQQWYMVWFHTRPSNHGANIQCWLLPYKVIITATACMSHSPDFNLITNTLMFTTFRLGSTMPATQLHLYSNLSTKLHPLHATFNTKQPRNDLKKSKTKTCHLRHQHHQKSGHIQLCSPLQVKHQWLYGSTCPAKPLHLSPMLPVSPFHLEQGISLKLYNCGDHTGEPWAVRRWVHAHGVL